MEVPELEARLRSRVHARFDGAAAPPELATNVSQVFATTPRRVGFGLRAGGLQLGWSTIAAAAALVLAVAVVGNLGVVIGPGTRPSSSPAPSAAAERYFIVLPPGGLPSKPESGLAGDVLNARMRALGVGNFTSATGNAIQFIVPADGPSDVSIRAVLAATGNVEFVPLPSADYPDGASTDIIGDPLPIGEPTLFSWEGIQSVAIDDTEQNPALLITLRPDATSAFADYTAGHAGETFAILIDGRVAMLPIINEPITSGQVTLRGGGSAVPGRPDEAFAVTTAILVGGMLPEAWREAVVPRIVSREDALAIVAAQIPGDPVESVNLEGVLDAGRWRAVWVIERTDRVTLDAISGAILSVAPAEALH